MSSQSATLYSNNHPTAILNLWLNMVMIEFSSKGGNKPHPTGYLIQLEMNQENSGYIGSWWVSFCIKRKVINFESQIDFGTRLKFLIVNVYSFCHMSINLTKLHN